MVQGQHRASVGLGIDRRLGVRGRPGRALHRSRPSDAGCGSDHFDVRKFVGKLGRSARDCDRTTGSGIRLRFKGKAQYHDLARFMGTANRASANVVEVAISEAQMIRQFAQVTIWMLVFGLLALLLEACPAADCSTGQCPRPGVRVEVRTPRVGVRVQVGRPAAVRVRGWRPARPGWLFFPRFE